jgi:magnesium-transporting ATPase (P-type)
MFCKTPGRGSCCLEGSETVAEQQQYLQCMDEIETDLQFIGVTAIEDKLQDEVAQSISLMLDAGVKVWMITGDKQETAINIAISCKLFTNGDDLLVCNGTKSNASRVVEQVCAYCFSVLTAPPTSPQLCRVSSLLGAIPNTTVQYAQQSLHLLQSYHGLARFFAVCGK